MKRLGKMLEEMVKRSASDLIITVDSRPVFRINEDLVPIESAVLTPQETEEIADEVMRPDQKEEFLKTHEMNVGLYDPNLGRFRVNILRQRSCIGLVVRRIESLIPSLDSLGLPSILKQIASAKRGLVLIVGSTGSGKSTSLAAMIGHRNQTLKGHIVTIEDPIEFVHDHGCSIITQREIGIDTNSFAAALKSSLRQAPDVISIGEIRDAEVLRAALAFAETGHLCLATLHSNNASQAIERILSFFSVEQHQQVLTQLSMTLRAVISQRLVLSKLNSRVAAVEVLLDTPRIKDLISRGRIDEIKEAMEKGARDGMQTFDQHLYELFYSGVISFDEAIKNADSANNLRVRARLADADPLSGSQVDELESAISAGLAISKNS